MCSTPPSPELLAANERLLVLRGQLAPPRPATPPTPPVEAGLADVLSRLPAHLGWESQAVTAALRPKPASPEPEPPPAELPTPPLPEPTTLTATCPLHPDLALALLRQERTADGRLWLLLRQLDEAGRGWVAMETAQNAFTRPDSPLHFCGERQFHNLLRQGEGLFWRVEAKNGRIWLISLVKVAASLGVEKLTGRAVTLPVSALVESIGVVRAHLYASFHSGRQEAPIARQTLTTVSGVSRRSQAAYEKRAGVKTKGQIAIGERLTTEGEQEQQWQHGTASFRLQDKRGLLGAAGNCYCAWQLPNVYTGPHTTLPNRRQRRLNRQLADLRNRGCAGNVQAVKEEGRRSRRYYRSGAAAWRMWGRGGQAGGYWRNSRKQPGVGIWFALPDSPDKPC